MIYTLTPQMKQKLGISNFTSMNEFLELMNNIITARYVCVDPQHHYHFHPFWHKHNMGDTDKIIVTKFFKKYRNRYIFALDMFKSRYITEFYYEVLSLYRGLDIRTHEGNCYWSCNLCREKQDALNRFSGTRGMDPNAQMMLQITTKDIIYKLGSEEFNLI